MRLDQLLVERGLAPSRSKAQRLILAGEVFVDGQLRDKPASSLASNAQISLKSAPKYVSQGGLKLEKAIEVFKPLILDKVCIDIGASTGGFTDCLLKNGAKKVYSVDVGKGQLDWKLRNDNRVVVMESINARHLVPDQIGEEIEFATFDVSFISLKLVIPPVLKCMSDLGELTVLVKPQFEAGPERVERGGRRQRSRSTYRDSEGDRRLLHHRLGPIFAQFHTLTCKKALPEISNFCST